MNSRSQTLLDTIERLQLSNQKELSIHCVGADELEAKSINFIIEHFNQLFNGLSARKFNSLILIFTGPNISSDMDNTIHEFVHNLGLNIIIKISTLLYHDYVDNKKNIDQQWSCPDIIVMFNAGLWGYDDWIPTINLFNMECMENVFVLITSYTLEESEDDQDTIDNICNNSDNTTTNRIEWIWEPQINKYRSLTPEQRETKPGDKDYYENYVSMCFKCSSTFNEIKHVDDSENGYNVEEKYDITEGILGMLLNRVAVEQAFKASCRVDANADTDADITLFLLSLFECKYALVRLIGFEISRKVIRSWLEQWEIEVCTGPFIDLLLFKRILRIAVDKYCAWDWAERTLFERIKNISDTENSNNRDNQNIGPQQRYLTEETFTSSLAEVAPALAAKHSQKMFFSLDEYGIGRVTLSQFKRILSS